VSIYRNVWLFISILLISLVALASQPAEAQELAPATITEFQITTLDNKPVRDTPLMAGATYRVNFIIEAAAGLKEKCILKTDLIRSSSSDRFWTLNGDYPGIDSKSWQPGQQSISFNPVAGQAQLELEGTIPEDYVSETLPDGQVLHLAKEIALVELSLESGTVVADRQLEVIDSSIEEYRNALGAKNLLVTNMTADPAYTNLAKAVVASAEADAKVGYTDLAMETLNAIPDSGWVQPRGSTSYQWIILGALVVVAGVSIFLLMRARGESGFLKRQTDSQAKRLQILAMKASRIGDPALTEGIEQVRKELEQAVGGS
jgi:hypothetical protein